MKKISISKNELYNILKLDYYPKDKYLEYVFKQSTEITFINCIFEFMNISITSFYTKVIFIDCHLPSLNEKLTDTHFITFNNCKCEGMEFIGSDNAYFSLTIINSNIPRIIFEELKTNIDITDCGIEVFEFKNCKSSIKCKKSNIEQLKFLHGHLSNIRIINSNIVFFFVYNLTIQRLSIEDDCTIQQSSILNINEFNDSKLYISNSKLGNLNIIDSTISKVNLTKLQNEKSGLPFIDSLNIYNSHIEEFELDNYIINTFSLSTTIQSNNSYNIISTQIRCLEFIELIVIGRLNLINVQSNQTLSLSVLEGCIAQLSIHNEFLNVPYIKNNFKASVLSIHRCNMGKTQLIGCDFSQSKLHFDNSNLLETILIGTELPKIIETPNENNVSLQQKEVYLQLKKIYENKSDSVNSIKYNVLELETYRKYLKPLKSNYGEKIVLFINRFTNYHGSSWVLAIKVLAITSIILYFVYLSFAGITLSSNPDYKLTWNAIAYIIDFCNPVHKTNEIAIQLGVKENNISGFAILIEGISRIIIGFLIYQLIVAFRKFGKQR